MVRCGRSPVWIAAFALLCVSVTQPASAQTLSLIEPHAGASVVGGTAEPGSGPITIYDTSYDVWAPIGRGNSMDTAGNFAVSVDPPPQAGDTILAEDAQGRQSAPVTVLEPTDPATGPTPE